MALKTKKKKPRGRPKQVEGRDGKSLILAAALDLFSKHGYDATSIKMIAEAVGFRDSALYSHFKGKDDVRETLMNMHGPRAVRMELERSDLLQMATDPIGFLKTTLSALAERWLKPDERKFFNFLMMENLKSESDPAFRLDETSKAMRQRVNAVIRMLQAAGKLQTYDADWLTGQFLSPILALRFEIAMNPAPMSLARVEQRLHRHVDLFHEAFSQR